MDEPTPLAALIDQQISLNGPMSLATYMGLCLTHPQHGYYKTRDPLGAAGDFITAPEISQTFGEMIGLWIGGAWQALGCPKKFNLVELGPGRGTLMADAMRVLSSLPGATKAMRLVLLETNAALVAAQKERLGAFSPLWIEDLDRLDDDTVPHIFIANEFFDALPIRQFQKANGTWHERLIGLRDGVRAYGLSPTPMPDATMPHAITAAGDGEIWEVNFAARELTADIARRITKRKGAMLAIDYGYTKTQTGDTFQALSNHAFVDPLATPGKADLTAHVDFNALSETAEQQGASIHPVMTQRALFKALGISQRLNSLTDANPDKVNDLRLAVERLMEPDQMGTLFKCLCITSNGLAPYPFQSQTRDAK